MSQTEIELAPQSITPMQSLLELARRTNDPIVAAAVAKSIVELQQSSERFQWEREAREDEREFGDALNRCQGLIGRIAPNVHRENNIWWADYAHLDRTVRPIYLAEGFSIGFSEVTIADPSRLRVCGTLTRGRQKREYFAEISRAPASSKMSQPDADASAKSRCKRYILLDIFNIAVGIDKEEKKGIPQTGEMAETEFVACQDNIKNASTIREAKGAYMIALVKATEANDLTAPALFRKIYDKRMEELNA
jgi:hypothetical protein